MSSKTRLKLIEAYIKADNDDKSNVMIIAWEDEEGRYSIAEESLTQEQIQEFSAGTREERITHHLLYEEDLDLLDRKVLKVKWE